MGCKLGEKGVYFWFFRVAQMSPGKHLISLLSAIEDPRVVGRTWHKLIDILSIALFSVLAGAQGWDEMEEWGIANEARLRQYLELAHGIPGHDTIRRIFEVLDMQGTHAKGVRALHSVTAYASLSGLVLAQQRCEEKSNEITAIEALLPVLSLKGSLVTIDAIGTQVAIAQEITERGGDYLLVAKNNQPGLAQAVEDYMRTGKAHDWAHMNPSISETLDKGHGRLETRHCVAVAAPDYLSELHRWPKLKSLVRIERTRDIAGQVSSQTQYLISSAAPDARYLLEASRMHWAIENGLHHCLDVTFREDASTVRLRNATANFATLRRITLNLLRMRPESGKKKRSMAARRKVAGWNPDYLFELLQLTPLPRI
jgi:predicted transposase YbfD/YdcC